MARSAAKRDQFRVIGGAWRGRRLGFPAIEGLRPTPDRVRETLFNWLTPVIAGARCLDLYCGSGALGIEALSRGAEHVTFVDRSREATDSVRGHLEALGVRPRAMLVSDEAERALSRLDETFEIVFLDPPFSDTQPARLLQAVERRLSTYNRVYLETGRETQFEPPAGWQALRDRSAGRVRYQLLTFEGSATE